MTEVFGWLSAFFVFAAAIQYIFEIIWGKTKPERGATLIWLTTNTVIFLSSRADGAADSLWLPFGDMVVGIIMFFLAIKYGYKWLAKRDVVSLIVAGIGVAVWVGTDQPLVALLSSLLVDAVGTFLVVTKSIEAPDTEPIMPWALYLLAGFLAALSVGRLDKSLLIYPLAAMTASVAIISAIIIGKRKSIKTKNS